MNKKLAHIEKITALEPIYNKKGERMRNLSASVLGWRCMVRPNEFKVGDLIIYVEVGSILPKKPEFEFLAKYDYRIKTQRYFGGSYLSQGLILPLNILPKGYSPKEGEDVTSILGITKFYTKAEQKEFEEEKKQANRHWTKRFILTKKLWRYSWFRKLIDKNQIKDFPSWVSKTDEERIQNLNFNEIMVNFGDKEIYVTEKIDYQSATFTSTLIPRIIWLHKLLLKIRISLKQNKNWFYKIIKFIHIRWVVKYKFVVCSRNQINNDKNSLYWEIARKYNLEQILKENPTLTIQGEQGSPKVQGNKYNIKNPKMWVFNIIDHERNYHYNYSEMVTFCKKYNLDLVPLILDYHKLSELGITVEDFVKLSQGKSLLADIPREGVVVRCIEKGKKLLSFKVINPDFEIKYKL